MSMSTIMHMDKSQCDIEVRKLEEFNTHYVDITSYDCSQVTICMNVDQIKMLRDKLTEYLSKNGLE